MGKHFDTDDSDWVDAMLREAMPARPPEHARIDLAAAAMSKVRDNGRSCREHCANEPVDAG